VIKTLYSGGRYSPMFVCDHCGEPIRNVALALALARSSGVTEGEMIETFHVHKGPCDRAVSARINAISGSGSTEMRYHLRYLLHNTGVSLEDMAAVDAQEEELGSL
jgi:hypothetical protein